MAFDALPIPKGNRVAILTNAGGPGIIIADACESAGLEVVELAPETQAALRKVLAAEASVRNPVDMIASATPETYRIALGLVLDDDRVDAAIAAFVPPLGVRQQDVAESIVTASSEHREKPILAVLMGREGLPQGRAELNEAGLPAYIFPESAARALAAMHRYRCWLARPEGEFATFDVDRAQVRHIIEKARAAGEEHLAIQDAVALLSAYGVPTAGVRHATTADEAATAAVELGLPAVLKILSQDVVHKSDVGGVAVDLRSDDEVREAFARITDSVRAQLPDARIDGVLVQPYVKGGRETIVGVTTDPSFGPVLMFGLGGIYVEALRDVTFRVHPVSDVDAQEMVREIRGHSMLQGIRGEPPSDIGVIVETIQRISQLVGENPEILELDINPFVVFEEGAMAVDARVRIDLEDHGRTP
ncbi:MAG: acetate--CoA ligase family protein [Gemmatimonadota bacterium]